MLIEPVATAPGPMYCSMPVSFMANVCVGTEVVCSTRFLPPSEQDWAKSTVQRRKQGADYEKSEVQFGQTHASSP